MILSANAWFRKLTNPALDRSLPKSDNSHRSTSRTSPDLQPCRAIARVSGPRLVRSVRRFSMTKLNGWKMGGSLLLIYVATTCMNAQSFSTLVNFNGSNGAGPEYGSLVQGRNGSLYGTTGGGGSHDAGTFFELTPSGELITLYNFCAMPPCQDGGSPYSNAILATDGNFYGTTFNGGTNHGGTVFKITPDGALTTLYNFCSLSGCADGQYPYGALVQGVDGKFYGTTWWGGDPNTNAGTIFKITSEGEFTILHTFDGYDDGSHPYAKLIQGTDGSFYGTAASGGPSDYGTMFETTTGGAFTLLYNIEAPFSDPTGGLVEGSDRDFYGTTFNSLGSVFRASPNGTVREIQPFSVAAGYAPFAGLIQATDGNFYGSTLWGGNTVCGDGCGTVFEITPSGTLTFLHDFQSTDGANPYGGLVQATNGTFYGMTTYGGTGTCNCGTVFSLSMGLGPFVVFVRGAGRIGQTGGILGQGLTGTTSVMLNGIPASFAVISDTFIKATVPPGATTGYVTVTTPTGVLTSNVPFQVIP